MNRLSGVICRQGRFLLENKWHALLHAVALALLPFSSWLSASIIALVTLRKGWRKGAWVLFPVVAASFSLSLMTTTPSVAMVNSALLFLPCYVAAVALRLTANWRVVAAVFFLQTMGVVVFLQIALPEFIVAQYEYLQAVLRETQADGALLAFLSDKTALNQTILAHYLIGLQAVGVVLSACLSLLFARAVQSHLFYSGGFKREMLGFRADKAGLFLILLLIVASTQQSLVAISLLPLLVFYFLLAGLSLSFNVLAKQKPWFSGVLLLASLLTLPFIMLPVYVIFGSLDSLFNFRLYLPSDAGKTI